MNGFFQIQIKEQGVNLLLFPPIGEGEQIRAAKKRTTSSPKEERAELIALTS